jgi:alpha-1,6-mannosyltransferase
LHTPEEGRTALAGDHGDPQLRSAAREAGPLLDLINHPDVSTIYPPVAQAAFLVAYWIDPWSGAAWRAVLLIGDVATVALLLVLLRHLDLPMAWIAIYWWNPLVVKEFYCAGHMDAIVLPLVIGALLLAAMNRAAGAATCLAAAVAAKFWPVILLPHILRSTFRRRRSAAIALGAFALTAIALLSPMLLAGRSGIAGTLTYSRSWQSNDGLFQLIVLFWQYVLPMVGLPALAAQLAARLTTAILLVAWLLWLARRPLTNPLDLCEACLLAVAGLFLLSPTQFPWYYTWMVPLLALRPRWSLLSYTALLPLYHFYREPAWVWVEHVPVWAMLISEFIWRRPRFGRYEPYAQEKLSIYEQSATATPA